MNSEKGGLYFLSTDSHRLLQFGDHGQNAVARGRVSGGAKVSLIAELKRRNVLRVAVAYIVVSWVIMQAGTLLFSVLELPAWISKALLALLVLGFVPAVILSWVYDLTPDGVKPTGEVTAPMGEYATRRLNKLTVAMVLVGVAFVLGDRFWPHDAAQPSVSESQKLRQDAGTGEQPPLPDSIAVLPFVNMSADPEQEFLGDGLAEELLNALAGVPGLKVAARMSSFSFKGKDATIGEVGAALNVRTVLEGSIRRSGDQLRITAQLIEVTDGYHLWSETYDRKMSDIFAIQDDISERILEALTARLGTGPAIQRTSPQAEIQPELYARFLWARRLMHDETRDSMETAHRELQAIAEVAPAFAPAWAMLANTWLELEQGDELGDIPPETAWPASRAAAEHALALDPNEPMAYHAMGHLASHEDRLDEAEAAYKRALQLQPAQVSSKLRLATLLFYQGRHREAMEVLRSAYQLDPLHPEVLWNLAHELNLYNQRGEAMVVLEKLYAINARLALGLEIHLYRDLGDGARAVWLARADLAESPDDPERRRRLASQLQWLGLHEDPVAQAEAENYVSLGVLGRDAEAARAIENAVAKLTDPWLRGNAVWRGSLARGDREAALEALWSRWQTEAGGAIGRKFDFRDCMALAALLKAAGRTEDNWAVLEVLGAHIGKMSASWVGGQVMFRGYLALLNSQTEEALRLLGQEADSGTAGFGGFGTALPNFGTAIAFPWLFEADPRLEGLLARFEKNRENQLVKLASWETHPPDLAKLRAGYVAEGGPSPRQDTPNILGNSQGRTTSTN